MATDEAHEAIKLIDEFLINTGQFDSYDIDISPQLAQWTTSMRTAQLQDRPASVMVSQAISFENSLAKQQQSSAAQRQRLRRINLVIKNETLRGTVDARLDHEYGQLDKKHRDAKSFSSTNVISKLRTLRILQQSAHEASCNSFGIRVAVRSDWKGSYRLEKAWLPDTATWNEFSNLLCNLTYHSMQSMSIDDLDTTKGQWMCQTFTPKAIIDKQAFPVETEHEYRALRERMKSDRSDVYVVHSATAEEASAKRRRKDFVEGWKVRVSERGQSWSEKNPLPEDLLALEEVMSWEELGQCPVDGFYDIIV